MASTYFITAGSGIGAETARELARLAPGDTNIFFTSLQQESCEDLKLELQSIGAVSRYAIGDLTDPTFAPSAAKLCGKAFGRIDALFNIAGASGRKFGDGPLHECTDEGWLKTLDSNLTTQFRMAREIVRIMLKQDVSNGLRGTILNMSSILATHPEPQNFDTVSYATSKSAILGLTRHMAASYLRQNIRVNAILPALVATPMSARASTDTKILAIMQKRQPLVGGTIPANEIAHLCVTLLKPTLTSLTGQLIEIDAGWSLTS